MNPVKRFLIINGLIGLIGMTACSSGDMRSMSSNQPPVVTSVEFFPGQFRQGHAIVAKAHGKDPENDAISYRYEWFVNQKSVHLERELLPHYFKRGDKIFIKITPNDGFNDGGPFKTAFSVVKNTPPEIVSIQLQPQPFVPGKSIKAVVSGKDNENDPIRYSYEWKKNGLPLFAEDHPEIRINDLKKGDLVTVKVTPHDGIDAGQSYESLNLKSHNRRPLITSSPPMQYKDGVYSYPVEANDPDGDPLEYSILDPQPGMHFHPKTGHFQWEIPDEIKGVHHVTLVVRDSEGEGAAQKVRLDIDFLRNHS